MIKKTNIISFLLVGNVRFCLMKPTAKRIIPIECKETSNVANSTT